MKNPRKTIYLEGVDGSGKTTLGVWLAEKLQVEFIPTDDRPKDLGECLARIHRRMTSGAVCDRSSGLISELVYGPVLRGGTITEEKVLWEVVEQVQEFGVFVHCRPPVKDLTPTTRPGEDPEHAQSVNQNLVRLYNRYDEVFTRMIQIGCQVIQYDRTTQSPEEVLKCVE